MRRRCRVKLAHRQISASSLMKKTHNDVESFCAASTALTIIFGEEKACSPHDREWPPRISQRLRMRSNMRGRKPKRNVPVEFLYGPSRVCTKLRQDEDKGSSAAAFCCFSSFNCSCSSSSSCRLVAVRFQRRRQLFLLHETRPALRVPSV